MRHVRRCESSRDSALVDAAFARFEKLYSQTASTEEIPPMIDPLDAKQINRAARSILRRLCENETYLLVSSKLDKAAVFKELVPGKKTILARVDQNIAEAFALKEWIAGDYVGSIGIFRITNVGRAALKRLLAQEGCKRARSAFQEQHRVFGERTVVANDGSNAEVLRYNLAESPLSLLARKKDANGALYLSADLLEAGERFRADFEAAQMGPRLAQNWDRFLTSGISSGWSTGGEGNTQAHERFSAALQILGPGLGDVALRVCCFLEGVQKAEKRLGWAARSGKVVLKIALQRLAIHYGIASSEQTRVAS